MSLLTYKNLVKYDEQQADFEKFLTNFKSSQSASASSAVSALQDLHLDDEDNEDDLSDEYDFMDDVDGNGRTRRRRQQQQRGDPKLKYMEVLQGVANRTVTEVLIELDDLDSVSVMTQ
ncbi:MAG: hypothetical protein M1823_002563 [Watsoniomyces obsoletus]|nr:MAG: hypothetical protein M1823_002563 [Watsoniomyces obsoletus]